MDYLCGTPILAALVQYASGFCKRSNVNLPPYVYEFSHEITEQLAINETICLILLLLLQTLDANVSLPSVTRNTCAGDRLGQG